MKIVEKERIDMRCIHCGRWVWDEEKELCEYCATNISQLISKGRI
ncbi:MAG: hypothetical protein QXP39_01645 [Candidatus Aenigmatarchaeota archaeon]